MIVTQQQEFFGTALELTEVAERAAVLDRVLTRAT